MLVSLFLACGAAHVHATSLDSLNNALSEAATTSDSIRILYDLYDLSPRKESIKIAWKMLEIAERTHDSKLGLDMLRQIANVSSRNDSVLADLQMRCRSYPESDDKSSTATFIALRRAGHDARYIPEKERLKKIENVIHRFQRVKEYGSPFDNIEQLGTLCILLGNGTHHVLLGKYIDKSIDMLSTLPDSDFAVRNLIYNQATALYTNINIPEKAIAANRQLLDIIERMTADYHRNGRKYRNFDVNKYTIYRNMLQNYSGMSDAEIQACYDSVVAISRRNPDLAAEYANSRIAEPYYLMATHRYREAIPLLRNIVDRNPDLFNRIRALRQLLTAAREVGDADELLNASTNYIAVQDELMEMSSQEAYAELQVIYDYNELSRKHAQLQLMQSQMKLNHQRILIIIGVIALLALVIVLIIVLRLKRKSQSLASTLAKSNDALEIQNQNLTSAQRDLMLARKQAHSAERQKTDFIDYINHEITTPLDTIVEYTHLIVNCADIEKKEFLKRYAGIVSLNTELITTTIHDLIDVAAFDDARLTVSHAPHEIGEICLNAIENMQTHLQPGVKLIFTQENAPAQYATTDGRRVEQALTNLLNNAAKFTSEGSITLSYDVDRDKNIVTFSVTDTGIGIPADKNEVIFERFRKLNRDVQGSGLGLPICAIIAQLLGGEVYLDTSYESHGCRFVFVIPLS